MIDLHSHILPGFDDGARNPEETAEMLRLAAENGTTDIVATPHAGTRFPFDPTRAAAAVTELNAACGGSPRVHHGCELHLTLEGIEDACRHPALYTIAGRGYLLVEFADRSVPRNMAGVWDRIISAGMRPIIAHPERHPALRERARDFEDWIGQGCLAQVTAQSLLGRFGRSAQAAARDLMDRRWVHVVASDGHDPIHRPPVLSGCREHVEREYGHEVAVRLFEENPHAVLEGRPVCPEAVPVRRKSWFARW